MQPEPSMMRLGAICAVAAAGLWAPPGIAGTGIHAVIGLERSVVIAGEPIVIAVALENAAEHAVMLSGDAIDVDWTVKTEGGRVVCAREPPHGEVGSLARTVPPGGQFKFDVIAYETAAIKPGRYHLIARYVSGIPEYRPPASPSPIAFEVLPGEIAALARRAQELHDEAVDQSRGEADIMAARAAEELASMRYAGSRVLLCDVLQRNGAVMGYALRRLERDPDSETVDCLLKALHGAASRAPHDAVEYTLKSMLRNARDPRLRARIEAAFKK